MPFVPYWQLVTWAQYNTKQASAVIVKERYNHVWEVLNTRQYTCPHKEKKKGYLKNQTAGKQDDRWHVITNRHISIRLEQEIEEERLVKMFQQVVKTAKSGFHQAFERVNPQ